MEITIKDLMIPLSEYATVGPGETLLDCFLAVEQTGRDKHPHRDALVLDGTGRIMGKVTMTDIFLALAPGYKSILESMSMDSVLTPDYLANLYREYDLWPEPLADLCRKAATLKVEDVMHEPDDVEYVDAGEPLDKALHHYVMGAHQPLLAREGDRVVGVLRLCDVFEKVKELVLACPR